MLCPGNGVTTAVAHDCSGGEGTGPMGCCVGNDQCIPTWALWFSACISPPG